MPTKSSRPPKTLPHAPQTLVAPSRFDIEGAFAAGGKAASSGAKLCELTFEEYFRKNPPKANYLWGIHTRAIVNALQKVSDRLIAGQSSYLIINVPPRHGKSDACSRVFPPWHLSRQPDHEFMLVTYGQDLSDKHSRDARRCFERTAGEYALALSGDRNIVNDWRIEDHHGGFLATSWGGQTNGNGAHIVVIDDYFKNRAEAESETTRNSVWDSFRADVMSRLAPVHAVVILATRWHENDLVGRILAEKDPEFPQFEMLNFPAWDKDRGWLFPERFPESWYKTQRVLQGSYNWESMFMGNPRPRTGKMLRTDLVQFVDKLPDGILWARGWDLASTKKQRAKDSPDFTVGTKCGMKDGNLYVAEVVRGQWTAPERDKRIMAAFESDGPGVKIFIEAVGGYKDTYERVKLALSGKAIVEPCYPDADKVVRAGAVEPLFEASKVFILRATWNDEWISELSSFPSGEHDDQVDSLVLATTECTALFMRYKLEII